MKKIKWLALIALHFFSSISIAQELVPYRVQSKWGFSDVSGKLVIPARYDEVYKFFNNYAQVVIKGKWGVIDPGGRIIVPVVYDQISQNEWNGRQFFTVGVGERHGLMNSAGKLIAPVKYDELYVLPLEDYAEATIVVNNVTKQFWIRQDGKVETKKPLPKPESGKREDPEGPGMPDKKIVIMPFNGYDQPYNRNGKQGYLIAKYDKYDTIPPVYDELNPEFLSREVAAVKKDGRWGIVDTKNKLIIPFQYEGVCSVYSLSNLYACKKDGKCGIIRPNGEIVIPFEWDDLSFMQNGRWCTTRQQGKRGIIILDSVPRIIPAKYESVITSFTDTYIDKKGKEVRFFRVKTAQGEGLIDEYGKEFFKD